MVSNIIESSYRRKIKESRVKESIPFVNYLSKGRVGSFLRMGG
jgi:hypothetical protein